jgi:hypothetical protein
MTPKECSNEARRKSRRTAMKIQERVLSSLASDGHATDDELEQRLDLRHQTLSAARRGLVKSGLVEPSGKTRPTRSGCKATVWCLTGDGRVEANSAEDEQRQREVESDRVAATSAWLDSLRRQRDAL